MTLVYEQKNLFSFSFEWCGRGGGGGVVSDAFWPCVPVPRLVGPVHPVVQLRFLALKGGELGEEDGNWPEALPAMRVGCARELKALRTPIVV